MHIWDQVLHRIPKQANHGTDNGAFPHLTALPTHTHTHTTDPRRFPDPDLPPSSMNPLSAHADSRPRAAVTMRA